MLLFEIGSDGNPQGYISLQKHFSLILITLVMRRSLYQMDFKFFKNNPSRDTCIEDVIHCHSRYQNNEISSNKRSHH